MYPKKSICLLVTALLLVLCGCGTARTEEAETAASARQHADTAPFTAPLLFRKTEPELPPAQVPDFPVAEFHEDQAQEAAGVKLDLSALEEGYVAVSALSDHRLKFQVIMGEATYNYDLASDGTPSIFPLQSGDGEYRFRVMENVVDSKYAELYSTVCKVKLEDAFQPFLRNSDYVPYDRESACVQTAAQITQNEGATLKAVSAIFDFVCSHVKYDKQKAATVQSGYLPDPDETLQTGKGICFDYAALAAAMLRSQGIPTKMIFGYVSPDGLYHAWNMFYTEETGWVTVSYEVKADSWNRLDLTFSANGADSTFIGDGSNYTDLYFY